MPDTRTITVIDDVIRNGFDQTAIDWRSWVEPGRAGVEFHVLWAPQTPASADEPPDGSAGLLLRFHPGAHGDRHRHLGYELMLVLDGVLQNDDGDRYLPGTLVIEHPDSIHQMSSVDGCTVLAIRTRPVDAITAPLDADPGARP
jgi:quercetin dioxygenase-like cupin family protein